MGREVDQRAFHINRTTSARAAELRALAAEVSAHLPGAHRITIEGVDPTTGNPARVLSESAPAERGHYIQRALEHVRHISRALGLDATQVPEFVADPHPQETSSGAVAVHLQQQYKGIAIFQATQAVRFTPNGTLQETAGSSVTVSHDMPVTPPLSVQEAVRRAAEHVAAPQPDEQGTADPFGELLPLPRVDLTGFAPQVLAAFVHQPDRSTVLAPGPFGDPLKANLIWFPRGDQLQLGWEVLITLPNYNGQYRTIVDANSGEILYCHQLVRSIVAQGHVYHVDGGQARQMTPFPRPLTDYELPMASTLPEGFPDHWVLDNSASGNGVHARLGNSGPTVQGTIQDGVLTFNPADPVGNDQKVLNMFYYNSYMHDFFYLLGFQELDGNFQQDNFGRGGVPSDRVDARAHSGAVFGTANMATPVDGFSPTMNMGLVTSTDRHTAFDSSVVFHEFMHGVTNRLVGGPMDDRALEAPQSGGMGEGWGDYIACTINHSTVVGAWVVNRAGGIRGFPYDSDFPHHFGQLGTGRYTEVHNIGEIWCATLMDMNRRIGTHLSLQLVIDALKLSPSNPSFLDMRDAILAALDHKQVGGQLSATEHSTAHSGIWAVFARFGMGPQARSNGGSISGIVADFRIPTELPPNGRVIRVETAPNRTIPDNQPMGITSDLQVTEAGRLTRVEVALEIEHPYIGDLRVRLTTPGGETVILHDRSGASADHLVRSYTSEDTPALAGLTGAQAEGDWVLQVADLAAQDLGTLRRWSLAIGLDAAEQAAHGEATPGLTIPDHDATGVSSAIAITRSGAALGIKVGVDITHTYIGDLRVELLAPSGQQAILHNRSGSSQDNLIQTYDAVATPALVPLIGQSVQGNWVLRVTDLAGQDIGKLNRWSLELAL